MSNYKKLQNVLTEVFQLDQADLDFGIYRIMNQKRDAINEFLQNSLPIQVKELLAKNNTGDNAKIQAELEATIKQLKELSVDIDTNTKVKELRSKLAATASIDELEQEVFSHLANFFKRYYEGGDFISLRRYKKDVYAIPYEGEEVKLHWANHDQYYIKTSEYLKNYAFKLGSDKLVKFQLKEASTEQNNNKTQNDQERRFSIFDELPIEVDGNTLLINFTYEPYKKSIKQEDLTKNAVETIKANVPVNFADVFALAPTESNKQRTLLEKHLYSFVARHTFDYFIHKDLGGFLRRELDFYIKNEVLYIDDINTENEIAFSTQISKIKALKQVANKIILFLEQLENFQKKLWLKKKFVISSNYCITLDKIPTDYYAEILENTTQLEEWKNLFDVEVKTTVDLENEPFLVLDTKFFTEDFKDKLLAEFEDLDEHTNGLLINSENFQALNLIQEKYSGEIKGIYVDPPYNAKSSEIIYKNTFKHSSWLSFIENRIKISKNLLDVNNGIFNIAIDENEQENLGLLLNQIFLDYQKTCVTIIHNASGQQGDNFSYTNEFSFFLYPYGKRSIGFEQREDKDADVRGLRDVTGEDSKREAAANCFYPILVKDSQIVGFGDVCKDDYHPNINVLREDGILEIYPLDPQGVERKWRFARQTVEEIKDELSVNFIKARNIYDIQRTKTKFNFKTVWSDSKYFANNQGTQILNNIIGKDKFSFPKSIYTVMDSITAIEFGSIDATFLDYFGGSGTTGHAIIKLNREDEGNRKYILVEMGTYFNTVTKPRIQKVIYTDNWKNAKPQDKKGISQMFKYMVLESYEDALNNLTLQQSKTQQGALALNDKVKEEYLLQYMLDVESQDHLFNLNAFKNPFNYQLNVTENNELVPTTVDLVETFNYLIGLKVQKVERIKDFKLVTGENQKGDKILVIWRNLEKTNNDDLNRFVEKVDIKVFDGEFDIIYVNGDNNLANYRKEEESWKVRLIEEEFFNKMFDVKDI
jgi:adenine-specific DNA-methyltransferase